MSWPASPNTLPAISMLCCHGIGSRPRHHAARRLNLTASNLKLPCGLHRMLSFIRAQVPQLDYLDRGPTERRHLQVGWAPDTSVVRAKRWEEQLSGTQSRGSGRI